MQQVELIATTAFGLEAIVEREVQKLGYTDTKVEDGRVRFKGDLTAICKANLWLRSAERVQLVIGEFHCPDFEQLFERTKEMPWEEWLTVDAQFPVYAKSVKSMLTATPSVQRAVKKAIVERLKTKHNRVWFDEEGPEYAIEISLLNDRALLTIDTSGEGLHKRGYRQLTTEAPLKETLAAAMIQLSYWNRDRILVDPFCGSGTIPIEAALIARNMPPGGNRTFAAENWPQVSIKLWTEARKEARDQRLKPLEQAIIATDMDSQVIRLARKHANDAGVGTDIHFERKMFAEFSEYREYGVMICNPPYGERMGDRETVDQLNEDFGEIIRMHPTWSFYCLTSHPWFERQAGVPASRRRKLYNGRIECTYYQYQGPRPPREAALAEAEAEAAIPPPPLDFKPNKPPTRGPAAGQVIDTVVTPVESAPSSSESRPAFVATSATGEIPIGLINRMKTLDFKPNKPPVRGPLAAPSASESDNSPVSGESSATPGVTSATESAPEAATTPWTRPIPAPPLDFKPMRPPTRGPFAAGSSTQVATIADANPQSNGDSASSELPAVSSAPELAPTPVAKEWSRPIPPPPLDFKPMRPPTRGPLAQPKSLAELAASGTAVDAVAPVTPTSEVVAPAAAAPVEPEVSPAVPAIEPPKPSEILAPSPVEPVRPAGLSLADLASRATPPQMDIAEGVG
ncbi:MAG: THUMP domain-containing protein [Planctomycetaceae bacterium]